MSRKKKAVKKFKGATLKQLDVSYDALEQRVRYMEERINRQSLRIGRLDAGLFDCDRRLLDLPSRLRVHIGKE